MTTTLRIPRAGAALALALAVGVAGLLWQDAQAHEGEDHGDTCDVDGNDECDDTSDDGDG